MIPPLPTTRDDTGQPAREPYLVKLAATLVIATIIVGSFAFGLACLFTLGEVVNWVEETRMARSPGRHMYPIGYWRPLLHVVGTIAIGVGGFLLMRAWCT